MIFNQWAIKWGVPLEALQELTNHLLSIEPDGNTTPQDYRTGKESNNQSLTMLDAAQSHGARLWRNNVGALIDDRGRLVRYGLCNETAQQNKSLKSSDLIGIKPVVITHSMVGSTLGQFAAREMKESSWTYTGTAREVAQLNFINLVNALGGDAKFSNTGRF